MRRTSKVKIKPKTKTDGSLPKLVRDNIPEILNQQGLQPVVKILYSDEDYLSALGAKLVEELDEFSEDYSLDELCDVLEVLDEMVHIIERLAPGKLDKIRGDKRAAKGGFTARRCLMSYKNVG
jgi:predicted house-cleaning noncanonical NTP pyrophosphatase (MazG superfamily)